MTTTRQMERLWSAKDYARLLTALLAGRSEDQPRVKTDTNTRLAAAAMALVRLDEFNQSHAPLAGELLRVLLAAQENDGGWGDPMTTALCVRALRCARGAGVAVERGVEALANLQKADGSFPAEPLRRMPSDAFVTAFVLYEVTDAAAIRIDQALLWLDVHAASFDGPTRKLVDRLNVRCRRFIAPATESQMSVWS